MNLGDFLKTIAAKSGIESTNKDLQAILDSPSLMGQEVPDELATQIQGNLFTIEAAKNNPTLINHFRAAHFNGVDAELNGAFDELSLEDSVRAELANEKSTPKRVRLAVKKIAELERAKIGASKGDKAELQKEIDTLNGKLRSQLETFEKEKNTLIEKHSNELLDNDVNTILSGYKLALPDEMDVVLKLNTAKSVVNKYLDEKDAKLVRDNGSLKVLRKSTGLDYYDDSNHNKVELKSFIDTALGQNKLLKTVETQKKQQTFTTESTPAPTKTTSTWDSSIKEAIGQVSEVE